MDVILLSEERALPWERFVRSAPGCTCAHFLPWRNVVQHVYRHEPYFLVACDTATVMGVLPLFLIRSRLFEPFLVTAPFLSYGGISATSPEASTALLASAQSLRQRLGARYLEIRNAQRTGLGLIEKTCYCTFLLPLDADPAVQWQRLEPRARKAVRKALKAGLSVDTGPHLVGELCAMLTRHVQSLGTPFHEEAFYRSILREFRDEAEILLIRLGDIPIAGGLVLIVDGTVHCLYGGGLRQYRALSAISYLYWEIIRHACLRGCRLVDFGRRRWDSNTFRFKKQWGEMPTPLSYEYDLAPGVKLPDMDPVNPTFHLAMAIWKQLPARVASTLGPHLIKHIP